MGKVTWNKDKLTLRDIFGSNCVILTGRNLNTESLRRLREERKQPEPEKSGEPPPENLSK